MQAFSRNVLTTYCRRKMNFSTSTLNQQIYHKTRVKVVDNSILGKEAEMVGRPAYMINTYGNTRTATPGDMIRVAVRGQAKKAIVVGCRQRQRHGVARFDTNNVVLLEDSGVPTATKIRVPIPYMVKSKGKHIEKILPNVTKFV